MNQEPDNARIEALAKHLIEKGIDASLAPQVARDILIFHPQGGSIRVQDGVVQVIARR